MEIDLNKLIKAAEYIHRWGHDEREMKITGKALGMSEDADRLTVCIAMIDAALYPMPETVVRLQHGEVLAVQYCNEDDTVRMAQITEIRDALSTMISCGLPKNEVSKCT